MGTEIRYFLSGIAMDSATLIAQVEEMGAVRAAKLDDTVTHLLAGRSSALEDKQSRDAAIHHVCRLTNRTPYVTAEPSALSVAKEGIVYIATLGQMAAAMQHAQARERVPAGAMRWSPQLIGSNTSMPMFVGV